jgi:uncharacterized protein (TIGR02145 family)
MSRIQKIMDHTRGGRLIPGTVMFLLLLFTYTCKRFEADQLVIIETGSVSDISHSTCSVTGEGYDAGADGIDQHGFVWSVDKDPLIGNGTESQLGSKNHTGSFTGSITGLSPSTTYYFKAYGTAESGTAYGKEVSFTTTSPTIPVLTTATVSGITDTTALCGGTITDDGGADILARGVCWDTTTGPTLANSLTLDGTGTGTFSSQIRNLDCSTPYYVRAYATNSVGTAYGEEQEFTTGACQAGAPLVTTLAVTSITDSSAMCGGNVTDDGGMEVTERGICWSTFQEPTVLDSHTTDGSGTGEFSSALVDLPCNTTYYVRAYATNGMGTTYGEQQEFTSEACPVFLPEVWTDSAYNISDSAAVSGGNVVDDGGAMVTRRGVCWGTQPNPIPDNHYTEDGTGTGKFTSYLSDLDPVTTYYYRAYARNSEGIGYGFEYEFTTPEQSGYVIDIDGNSYKTVLIGTQTWMAENLKVSRFADGTSIPLVEDQATWGDLTITDSAYCYYNYDIANREVYGALYSWPAAMNGAASSDLNPSGIQGVCPAGWHLPSDAEWKEMEMSMGMTQEQADSAGYRGEGFGGNLKATGTDYWKDPNTGANNKSGFSALPGGHNNSTGFCSNRTIDCYFWSSTDSSTDNEIWYRYLKYERADLYRGPTYWYGDGYSVRCVKDE